MMSCKSDTAATLLALAVPLSLLACKAEDTAEPATASIQVPGAAAEAAPTHTGAAAYGLAVEAEGLRLFDPVSGSARPLPFGTDWTRIMAALTTRGISQTGRADECGAGPLDYATWDSLTLYGQEGKFVGWLAIDEEGAQGSSVTTAAGVGPGSSRKELESAYSTSVMETTLGVEFSAGDLFGLLEGPGAEAKITHLWAGVSCNFR